MTATLFWKLSEDSYDKLEKSFPYLLRNQPSLKALFNNVDNKVEHFCQLFFPSNGLAMQCFLANLSLTDLSDKKISLAIRVPHHASFAKYLPDHCTVSVIGYWSTRAPLPIFAPEKIIITNNNIEAANYEHEIEFVAQKIDDGQRPPHGVQNILTPQLAQDLPKISVETNNRLQEWRDFLNFKRRLIRQKTAGLRYIHYNLNPNTLHLELLVLADSETKLQEVRRIFTRQNLRLFSLDISSNDWSFALPEDSKDSKGQKQPRGFELAQVIRGKNGIKSIRIHELDKKALQALQVVKETVPFEKPVFAWLSVELDEDWKNKLEKIQPDATEEETLFQNQEILEDFIKEIPPQGFVSFSMIGDLALIDRHERTVKNLRQNENCYSPYLSSYLFDITQAQVPKNLVEIDQWFNNELNETQKNAVKKMLAAPDLCLIQGPPGTGKTTVIAEAILQFAKRGQTVLLASQAHDAIDNALSRIRNHPELRAIRLAKETKSNKKITDEGQLFAGHQALARHYDALAQYIDHGFLQPLITQKEKIETLKQWLNEGSFLQADLQKISENLSLIKQQGTETLSKLKHVQQVFESQKNVYEQATQQKQQLEQLVGFLQRQNSAPMGMPVPADLLPLVETLFLLEQANIDLPFRIVDFKANADSQMLILTACLEKWTELQQHLPQISVDIARLQQAGTAGLGDIETTITIHKLQQEVDELNERIDDSQELFELWKGKRAEIKELKQKSGGLDLKSYKLFKDGPQFANVQLAQQVAVELLRRVIIFERIEQLLAIQQQQAIQKIQQDISNLVLIPPDEKTVVQLQQEIETLREQYKQKQKKQNSLRETQITFLAKQNFTQGQELQSCLDGTSFYIKELEMQYAEKQHNDAAWTPLFEQWYNILQQADLPLQDWEHVSSNFIENCNLVAISCNENEHTLKNANLDSFDVAIIDEVSKATPLELLLPLMRARKAILVGDHRQLPPTFQDGQDANTFEDAVEQQEDDSQDQSSLLTKDNFKRYEKLVTASLFRELFEKAPEILRERLTVQFRMHPDIMKMINYFYDGQLSCGNPDADRNHNVVLQSKDNILLSPNDHLLWVDTSYDEKGHASIDVEGSSNPVEARLIAQTLKNINDQMLKQGFCGKKRQKVGVVSFYQSQCRVIRDEIRKVNQGQIHFDAIDVEVNTVIRYQGKEKPIILVSLVRNDGKAKDISRSSRANVARFEYINVAMSRAQNLLIVFGARNMLELRDIKLPKMDSQGEEKKKIYKDIFDRLDRNARIYSARELVQALSG